MKKIFFLLAVCLNFGLFSETPHLILNFDVNKTLIASDKTENKSLEDVINELLSRKYFACWDERVEEPISFDAYVKEVLMPGEEHNIKLKMERLVHLTHFLDYLADCNHPLYSVVEEQFTHIITTLKGEHIFPSFFRLLDDLEKKEIKYTLFLRSFGKEVFEVKNEINCKTNDLFQKEGTFRKGILQIQENASYETPEKIYQFFTSNQHAAIHDDWPYWVAGEMEAKYGKPLYINCEDPNTLSIFFDDNIKIDSYDKNIIAPLNCKTGEALSIQEMLKTKQMIFVDTLEAITNENYFIERLQEALDEHAKRWNTDYGL